MSGDKVSFGQKVKWRLEVLAYDTIRLLLSPFSIDRISAMGGAVLRFIGPKTSKQNIVMTGLRTAFPEKSEEELRRIAREQWDNTGRTFAEFLFIGQFKIFDENGNIDPEGRISVSGMEHWPSKTHNKAAVWVGGHFANWEILSAAISQHPDKSRITYRPLNNPYMDERIARERRSYGVDLMTPKSGPRGAKQLIDALREGYSIALMNDQKFNEGIEVDFFGFPAMTAPGPSRLALKTGGPLMPMTIRRRRGPNGFEAAFDLTVHPPFPLDYNAPPVDEAKASTQRVTDFIAKEVRDAPEQWFWSHRRWDKAHYRRDNS